MTYESLTRTLDAVGKLTVPWQSIDGTRVLVLPYGGRILGLFAHADDNNFFWTHTALEDANSARSFYEGDQWHNSGGVRTWLAPEVDFFFPDYPSLNRYWQQRELDPGNYTTVNNNGILTWQTKAALTLSRTQQVVSLTIAKSLAPALNPLRYDQDAEWAGLKYAGYTLNTSLEISGNTIPAAVGIWQLTQMPHGGDLIVPTLFHTDPKIYMGTIGPQDLESGEHAVRYRMRAPGEHKLGLRAIALTGRAGYIYGHGEDTSLIIQNFNVNPSGDYVDVPWLETENFGFAFHACNVNSHLGAFSELEYHAPAIGAVNGQVRSEDQSQLWAFRGPERAIKAAARHLLSSEA